ncbi:YD repeat protein [Calothrix brevissima NIES-22]|nr:YD repeat protein [Calothrix brevissima NIES-22]
MENNPEFNLDYSVNLNNALNSLEHINNQQYFLKNSTNYLGQSLNFQSENLIETAQNQAVNIIEDFIQQPNQILKLQTAFGVNSNLEATNVIIDWLTGQQTPQIAIVSGDQLYAKGAYSQQTNTIYFSQQFLQENYNNQSAITAVFLEELGHYFDARLNTVDSPGDEGEIFAHLVQNHPLTPQLLTDLQQEDDSATRLLNGQLITVELASLTENSAITRLDHLGEVLRVPESNSEGTSLLFQWTAREAAYNNEIGVFLVDEQGRVNGINPGEAGYAQAALTSTSKQVLFTSGQGAGGWRQLTLQSGQYLAFYLIQNNTTAGWLATNPQNQLDKSTLALFSVNGANPDNFNHVKSQDIGGNIWQLRWEDLVNGGDKDFNDVVFNMSLLGLQIPGNIGQTTATQISFLGREARLQHEMGLFIVDDLHGRIGNITPDNPNYIQAALSAERRQVIFAFGQNSTTPTNLELPSGKYLGWYLISNGTTEQFLKDNPQNIAGGSIHAFFSYPGANADGLSHVHHQSSNELVWEDIFGGGDRDYNDLTFRFSFTPPNLPSSNNSNPVAEISLNLTDNNENIAADSVIGNFTIGGVTTQDNYIYSLVSGDGDDDNNIFKIVGNKLIITQYPDFETKPTYKIRVRSTDQSGLSFEDSFIININNLNEAPVINLPDPQFIAEDTDLIINDLSISDVDASNGDLEVSLTANQGLLTLGQTTGLNFIAGDGTADSNLTFTGTLSAINQALANLGYRSNPNFIGDDIISVTVNDQGNSGSGGALTVSDSFQITVSSSATIVLTEDTLFNRTYTQDIEIPENNSVLSFTYSNLKFDNTDTNSINDAFEVALVDNQGNALVHTIKSDGDAFFNFTEDQPLALAAGTTVDNQTVKVNLSGLTPGSAKLIFRLVNNDSDTNTTVSIHNIQIQQADSLTPVIATPEVSLRAIASPIDFKLLSDITSSIVPDYQRTSFNEDSKVLYTAVAVRNSGNYIVDAPLAVAIKSLSDPTVQVVGADGITPEGLPYFNLSNLVADGSLEPNEITQTKTISFFNPQQVQFDYELVFFGQLNTAPQFITDPDVEAVISKTYTYAAQAKDVNNDTLTYSLLLSPEGMEIDSATGKITWDTDTVENGNYTVSVQVADSRGGFNLQNYIVEAIAPPPNRPPVFTSTPIVDARVNTAYQYQAIASDPDSDNLTFSLVNSPQGMTIDENTGLISWTPNLTTETEVRLKVEDGNGGVAEQIYQILTQQEAGNNAPIIISQAIIKAAQNQNYIYDVNAIDADKDKLTYSLISAPAKMTINPDTGEIIWDTTNQALGNYNVKVRVEDSRGGVDNQEFIIALVNQPFGEIQGTNWEDVNGNGFRDTELVQGQEPDVIFVIDVSGSADFPFQGTSTGDVNQDGLTNTILDAELAAFLSLNNQLISQGLGNKARVGIVVFSGFAAQADMDLVTSGLQLLTTPSADKNNNGIVDVEDVLRSITSGAFGVGNFTGTNFETALQKVENSFETIGTTSGNGNVIFLSDGEINRGGAHADEVERLRALGVTLSAFGVGQGASLKSLQVIDPNAKVFLSTDELLNIFSGLNGEERFIEPGLGGVTVYLDLNNNGLLDVNEPSQITAFDNPNTLDIDETGQYKFTGLEAGTYIVREVIPQGYTQTYPINSTTPIGDGYADVILEYFSNGSSGIQEPYGGAAIQWPIPINPNVILGAPATIPASAFNPQVDWLAIPQNSYVTVEFTDERVVDGPGNDIFIHSLQETAGEQANIFISANGNDFEFLGTIGEGGVTALDLAAIDFTQVVKAVRIVGIDNGGTSPGFDLVGVQALPGSNLNLDYFVVKLKAGEIVDNRNFGNQNTGEIRPNKPPIFTSNAPINAAVGEVWRYNAIATDPDSDRLSFDLPVKSSGMAIDEKTGILVWNPDFDQVGVHDIILRVQDGNGGITLQAFQLNVTAANAPPVITSTPPTQAVANLPYEYKVRAQDADGDKITYRLDNAPDGMVIDENTGVISYTPVAKKTTLTFDTSESPFIPGLDNSGFWSSTFPSNNNPIDQTDVYATGEPYYISSNLPTGDVGRSYLTFDLSRLQGTVTSAKLQLQRYFGSGDPTETLGLFDVSTDAATLNNRIGTNAAIFEDLGTGSSYGTFDVSTSGNSQDILEFELNADAITAINDGTGGFFSIGLSILSLNPNNLNKNAEYLFARSGGQGIQRLIVETTELPQTEIVQITASDSQGEETSQSYSLTVVDRTSDKSPEITSNPRTRIRLGSNYYYLPEFTDPDGAPLTVSLENAPIGMTVDEQGLISWTPTAAQFGVNSVTLQVSNGRSNPVTQTFTINVVSTDSNQAPTIDSSAILIATANRQYQYDMLTSDPDGDPVVLNLKQAPPGISIDSVSGKLRWTPTVDQIGSHEVIVEAIDGQGGLTQQIFTITVRGVNLPPAITSNPPTIGVINQVYTYQVIASDPEYDSLTYSLINPPVGMIIDTQTGLIQWKPTKLGAQKVEILVNDGQGGVNIQTYQLQVLETAPNLLPTITSKPVINITPGLNYQYDVDATDPEGTAITYSLQTKPDGMTIDPQTGLITWQTTADLLGELPVVVVATDTAGGRGIQSFKVKVAPNDAPVIVSNPATTIVQGQNYRYDIRATDANSDRLTYTLVNGPNGVTIDNFGRLAWQTGNIGEYAIAIQVADGRGGVATQSYNLAVTADTQVPLVDLGNNNSLFKPGDTLKLQLRATDNVGVESLSLTINGSPLELNPGSAIAGTIQTASLTLNQPGLFEVLAQAKDAAGNIGSKSLQIRVFNPSDNQAPVVTIDTSKLQATGGLITNLTDIIGTVTDDNLEFYRLEYAPVSQIDLNNPGDADPDYITIAQGNSNVVNTVIGQIDPTILRNDSYFVRIFAQDINGLANSQGLVLNVSSENKPGRFALAYTDLSIPLAGIPIEIQRRYDSLDANFSGDFGYGWSLGFQDAQIQEASPTGVDLSVDDFFGGNSFTVGTRVSLTTPDGRRVGFTFNPVPDAAGLLGTRYKPTFTADAGVYDKLEVDYTPLTVRSNGAVGLYLFGFTYNPSQYRLITKEGITYRYDQRQGLLDVTDKNGNKLTYTDAGIVSSTGQSITFKRDTQGRIAEIIDPSGKALKYSYDTQGNLVNVSDRNSNKTQFVYDTKLPSYLTEIIDPLGRKGVRTEYDEQGRLARIIDGNGNITNLGFDTNASVQTITDGLGNKTTLIYDSRGNIISEINALGGVTQKTYDANNNLLSVKDPLGNTTTYTYDSRGNLLTQTNGLNQTTTYTYNDLNKVLTVTDPLGNTTKNTYDSQGNLVTQRDAAGNVTTYAYDARGNVTSVTNPQNQTTKYEYDSQGRIIGIIDALNQKTGMTYDGNGNLLSTTTPLGNTTRFTYDAEGRPNTVTDALGNVSRIEYNALGDRTATIDALGRRREFSYDTKGQLTQNRYPDGTTEQFTYDANGRRTSYTDRGGRTTIFVYDALGRLIETIAPDATPDNLADNPRIRREYDATGRLTALIDERGNRTEYGYDVAGRQILVRDALDNRTRYAYNATGEVVTITDALNRATQFVYDPLDRIVETLYPDGTKTITTYDALGRVIAETDQAGITTQFEYDALDRLTAVVDALGQRTEYGYDAEGNLLSQKDAKGNTTTYQYDLVNQRLATILPLGQRSKTTYDAVGNITSVTDFNGKTITYTYNSNDQVIAEGFADGTSVTYTYTPTLQRATVTDARGVTRYTYDERDQLRVRTETDGRTISYTYDLAGNRTSLTTPAGTVGYSYDALNRMQTVTDRSGGVTKYIYDAVGNLVRTELPNNTVETRQYDSLDRLIAVEQKGSSGVIAGFEYTLGPVGNRLAVKEANGRQVNYTYDKLYRLVTETISDATAGNRTISYTYDAVGNRLTRNDSVEGVTTYTYDNNDRLLKEILKDTVTEYTYDENGSTLSVKVNGTDTVNYRWDDKGRLIAVDIITAKGIERIEYLYDADDNRVTVIVNGQETRYLIDTEEAYAQVVEEYTADGTTLKSYVYGLDLISQDQQGKQSFNHAAGLGSVNAVTDSNGNVTDRYVYDAFGRLIGQQGNTDNEFRFTGEQFDKNSNLYYLRARYYDPENGRFISKDSFEGFQDDPLSLHKYIYAHNNPVNLIDPSGNASASEYAILGLIIAATVYDAYNFAKDPSLENGLYLALDLVGLAGVGKALSRTFGKIGNILGKRPRPNPPIRPSGAGSSRPGGAGNPGGMGGDKPPSTPTGRDKSPFKVEPGTNSPANIRGRDYTGHALDEMQSDGITPSTVENIIQTAQSVPGKKFNTTAHYDPINHITVITDTPTGRVVTVSRGRIKQ